MLRQVVRKLATNCRVIPGGKLALPLPSESTCCQHVGGGGGEGRGAVGGKAGMVEGRSYDIGTYRRAASTWMFGRESGREWWKQFIEAIYQTRKNIYGLRDTRQRKYVHLKLNLK